MVSRELKLLVGKETVFCLENLKEKVFKLLDLKSFVEWTQKPYCKEKCGCIYCFPIALCIVETVLQAPQKSSFAPLNTTVL